MRTNKRRNFKYTTIYHTAIIKKLVVSVAMFFLFFAVIASPLDGLFSSESITKVFNSISTVHSPTYKENSSSTVENEPTKTQATHIVDDENGIDNGVSPFATIAAAITAANAGDIISVNGGSDNT